MIIITDPRCTEYSKPGHPERPPRVARTVEKLRAQTDLPIEWETPGEVADESILRAHSREHLARIRNPPGDLDGDTPAYPGIAGHAARSVGAALQALRSARAGQRVFSLMRPPGHHATPDRAMGFCYLNSIAIAVLEARALGVERVAVFDFDVHHGNGTEDILRGRAGCAFFSVHQHPAYPGTGTESRGNCHNYPVPPESPREAYRDACARALEAMDRFAPQLIAVSAGFDAYKKDPLCSQRMEEEDFHWLGQAIHRTGIPAFSVLEGGYSSDLPNLVFAYLRGLSGL